MVFIRRASFKGHRHEALRTRSFPPLTPTHLPALPDTFPLPRLGEGLSCLAIRWRPARRQRAEADLRTFSSGPMVRAVAAQMGRAPRLLTGQQVQRWLPGCRPVWQAPEFRRVLRSWRGPAGLGAWGTGPGTRGAQGIGPPGLLSTAPAVTIQGQQAKTARKAAITVLNDGEARLV